MRTSGLLLFLIMLMMYFFILKTQLFGQEITGNIDITYQKSTTEVDGKKESSWSLFQNYYLDYSSYLTANLGCNFGLRVNRRDSNYGDQTLLYPTLSLNTMNEYFSGNISYDRIEQFGNRTPGFSTSFWNINMMSQLEEWPKINIQYTRSREKDHLEVHQTDTKSSSFIGGITHEYKFLDMMYNYMRTSSTDLVNDTKQVSNNHISRLGLHQGFFNNRLTFFGEGGFNYFESTGSGEQKRTPQQGFYGIDATPEYSILTPAPDLVDGNLRAIALKVEEYTNIGVGLYYKEDVDTMYIYTENSYIYQPTIPAEKIIWAVYWSNDEGEEKQWTLITSNANFSFSPIYHRFEIFFSKTTARYFKVVYYPGTLTHPFSITEIEVYGVEETAKTLSRVWMGNFNVSARPLQKWTTGYHISYYRTKTSPGEILTYTLSQGANITGDISKYLSTTLSYQTTKSVMPEEKTRVDSYTLNLRSSPIETLTSSLSFTHTITKLLYSKTREKGTLSKVDSIILNNIMTVWEGVDINWDINISRARNPLMETKSWLIFSDLYLRALLTRNLSWDIGYDQSWQKTTNEETEKTTYTNINTTLVYTPSPRLYGRIFLQYNKTEVEKMFSHEYAVGIFLTQKVQLNLISRFTEAETDEMTHSVDLNWNIGRHSSIRTGYTYTKSTNETEEKSTNFYIRYSSSF